MADFIETILSSIAVICGVLSIGGLIVFGLAEAVEWALEVFSD